MTSKYDQMMKEKNFLPFNIDYLPPQIVQKAKDELKEREELIAPSLEQMRELLKGEKELRVPVEDDFLLQFLRARKFDVKRAATLALDFFEVKKSYSDLYDHIEKEAIMKIISAGAGYCLPYRDSEGCAVVVLQIANWNPEETNVAVALTAFTVLLMLAVQNPVTQVSGVRLVVDLKGFSLSHLRCFTPKYLHLLSRGVRNSIPLRWKGIHFINESSLFQYLWSLLKILLIEKIRKRVHFHGDKLKNLHKHIPKEILHAEYEGDNFHFTPALCAIDQMRRYLPTFTELMKYGYE